MKKSVLVLFFLITVGTMLSFAQTVQFTTYGVAPYVVEEDTVEHYFNTPYNGLTNVGINAKVYLLVKSTSSLPSVDWSFTDKPTGSAVAFGTVKNLDASNQIITFIPDLEGTYKVKVTVGTFTSEMVFNAGKYLGVETGTVSCKTCHQYTIAGLPEIYNKWSNTGHANSIKKAVNGQFGQFFPARCYPCHTTGFDVTAANDGFDDFPFVYPTPPFGPGRYDQLLAQYPDAMGRANIQCEACHGPGSAHFASLDDSKMVSSLKAEVCAYCHSEGVPLEWEQSAHATGTNMMKSPPSCTPCHNGQSFVNTIKGRSPAVNEIIPITCAACHDPHDATHEFQLRKVTATLTDGTVINNAGTGGLCINCHKARSNAVTYVPNYLSNLAHFGPHHGPQANILIGNNAYTWGQTLDSSPHFADTENSCVDCHMFPYSGSGTPTVGVHTFNMTDADGNDNVAACTNCHGNVGTHFSDKKFYINGNADLDRNGVAEGLQIEVQGLMDQLAKLLPPVGSLTIDPIDSTWTLDQAGALYNYTQIMEDKSLGIHNPRYTVGALYLSIGKLGGIVSVDDLQSDLPTDYTLSNNYPNPFNPTTTIDFTLPEQTNAKLTIYDALGNQVDVIADGVRSAGKHSVKWNASNYSSGVYFYKLEAGNFVKVQKMILMK